MITFELLLNARLPVPVRNGLPCNNIFLGFMGNVVRFRDIRCAA